MVREPHEFRGRTIWNTATNKELWSKALIIAPVILTPLQGKSTTSIKSTLPLGASFLSMGRKNPEAVIGQTTIFSGKGAVFRFFLVQRVFHGTNLSAYMMKMRARLILLFSQTFNIACKKAILDEYTGCPKTKARNVLPSRTFSGSFKEVPKLLDKIL